jgi:5-methylcytosine-specific restriction endonuclease McrA
MRWADVQRIIFDGPSNVIEVGRRRRLFVGSIRGAVLVRDRGCQHPSCDAPLDRCEVDHIHPWCDGGETTLANGEALCDWHNRRKGRMPRPAA